MGLSRASFEHAPYGTAGSGCLPNVEVDVVGDDEPEAIVTLRDPTLGKHEVQVRLGLADLRSLVGRAGEVLRRIEANLL